MSKRCLSEYLSVRFLVNLHYAMHNRNVSVFDLEYYYLPGSDWVVVVRQKEDVTSLESGLHRTTSQEKIAKSLQVVVTLRSLS